MALPLDRRKGRQRGGRHIYGTSRRSTVKNHILIDDELKNMIEAERRPEEIINETLWRMLRERTTKIQKLQKKVDALGSRLEQFQEPSTEIVRNEITRSSLT